MDNIIAWLPLAAFVITYFTFVHNMKKDNTANADRIKEDQRKEDSLIEAIKTSLLKVDIKLDQVCVTTSDIKSDIKGMDKRINEFDKRLAIVERDVEELKEGK